MISPISSSTAVPVSSVPTQSPAPKASSAAPQDTVQLSPQAKAAASGDVDHDGDSH